MARNVTVFNISKPFALQASDRDLRAVIVGLQERHIKLSMQATPLEASPICGRGVEGYETPGDMGRVAHRLLRLGATLDYLSMDEPLFYGHYFKGRGTITSCQDSIAELARAALQSVLRSSHLALAR